MNPMSANTLHGQACRPILMCGEMVRATLRDVDPKLQTRRKMKNRQFGEPSPDTTHWTQEGAVWVARGAGGIETGWRGECPYGRAGDLLYVKEAHAFGQLSPTLNGPIYRADGREIKGNWRPSIFMPRWASRITLEIVSVRVERLQSISAKDIIAEGAVDRPHEVPFLGKCPVSTFDGKCYPDLRSLWAAGWESINGKGSWAANPWIWRIEFRRVTEAA